MPFIQRGYLSSPKETLGQRWQFKGLLQAAYIRRVLRTVWPIMFDVFITWAARGTDNPTLAQAQCVLRHVHTECIVYILYAHACASDYVVSVLHILSQCRLQPSSQSELTQKCQKWLPFECVVDHCRRQQAECAFSIYCAAPSVFYVKVCLLACPLIRVNYRKKTLLYHSIQFVVFQTS